MHSLLQHVASIPRRMASSAAWAPAMKNASSTSGHRSLRETDLDAVNLAVGIVTGEYRAVGGSDRSSLLSACLLAGRPILALAERRA